MGLKGGHATFKCYLLLSSYPRQNSLAAGHLKMAHVCFQLLRLAEKMRTVTGVPPSGHTPSTVRLQTS